MSITGSPLRVLFICRGSTRDGIGHVIRSRTVASAMRAAAKVKMLVVGDAYVDNLLAGRDLDYVIVGHEDEVLRGFMDFRPQVSVFDLMHFDQPSFDTIRRSGITVSLSPIFNCLGDVDLVFHRTSILGEDWPSTSPRPLIRSGLQYTITGEHCRRIPEDVFRQNLGPGTLSVAVSMGGTDAANKTLQVVNTVKQVPGRLLLWVLLGEGYAHSYQELVDSIRASKHEIILAKTNDSMWRILSTCSLAILAGGTTTYEAAYAGLPSINTLETDRHYFLIQELVERGACLCAGRTFDDSLRALNEVVTRLNANRDQLLDMHRRTSGLVDGLGVQRIIDEIQQYYRPYEDDFQVRHRLHRHR